ncbi:MAG TPA: hypothetical protein PLC67_08295, partial [Spirochaetota bacterium]|nr:hypothetical protein [Spirochaetota bacterium]
SVKGLGERTMHSLVMTVSHPMVDVIGGFGYAKAPKEADAGTVKEDNLTAFAVGAIVKLPVNGLNVFAQVANNNWAMQLEDGNADDTVLKNTTFTAGTTADDGSVGQKKAYKALCAKVGFYSITDLGDGMYVAPAVFYQYYKLGKDNISNEDGKDVVTHKIRATAKFSKALTQNIAFVPALGYARTWDDNDDNGDKAAQSIQVTAGVDMGLNTGYWAGQRISVYATYVNVDKDHKDDGDAFAGKSNRMFFGTYVTFGF